MKISQFKLLTGTSPQLLEAELNTYCRSAGVMADAMSIQHGYNSRGEWSVLLRWTVETEAETEDAVKE